VRALLVVHALLATALAGAVTHLAVVALKSLTGRKPSPRLVRIYGLTCAALCLAVVAVGLVLYPAYKVQVFAAHLKDAAPWAGELFELKEAAGLFTLPLGVGLFLLGRRKRAEDEAVPVAFAVFALALFALVAFAFVSGLVIVAEKGL